MIREETVASVGVKQELLGPEENEYSDCKLEVAICDFKNGLEDSMTKDNSELIDVNSDENDRVRETSHI